MESTDHDRSRRIHLRYLAWVLVVVLVVAGFHFILTSVTEISHFHFWLGLLLFMLGCFWYGYDKGYNVGWSRGYEKGVTTQKKVESEG